MSRPDLSIIIVTWNVRDLALACLDSIYANCAGLDIDVVIVDNSSEDGTTGAIRAAFPDVRVLEAEGNVGFPRANNLGFGVARGRHILYLNPDTVVGPGALVRCVEELDSHSALGVVGCRLVYPDGRVQRESGRRIYRLRHLAAEVFFLHMLFPESRLFGHHLMGDWDHRDDRDVEAVSGAFMMARRETVEAVGGLPDDLFMYHEDMAFCLRARRAGWGIRMLGSVESVHLAGQSSAQRVDRGLALLSGEYRIRLIREADGGAAAAIARALFALRSAVRVVAGALLRVVPGAGVLRRRYPQSFDVATQWLLLRWAVVPGTVAHLVPTAPAASVPGGGGRLRTSAAEAS
jgi:GT2 family glycosyltransferase